jgi:3-deoxy-D-manno-octulosonic-acid transferase
VAGEEATGWMRRLYTLLWILALPFALLRLLWRSRRAPAYRRRWAERFGRFVAPTRTGGVWVHAVSVGETQAAQPLVKRLLAERAAQPVTVTTTTPTGSVRVGELFGDQVFHVYLPFDLPWAVSGFLDRVRPSLLIMVETEIWPNLLAGCAARGIPTLLANARLSARSARGYARLDGFARATFGAIGAVAAQSDADAERFVALGVPPDRVRVTGSMKFDVAIRGSVKEQAEVLRRDWGSGRPVWVAASTHEGEEEAVLEAHRQVRAVLPEALLVLVPRHPERFERAAQLVRRAGLPLVRRTERVPVAAGTAVFLGDTMGELAVFLGAADAAFVGGSLVDIGGHNVLEPAAFGVPVVFGPHMHNFAAISRLLLEADAAVQVRDGPSLGEVVLRWLGDASERTRIGENGRRVVEANRGALDRTWQMVLERLPPG